MRYILLVIFIFLLAACSTSVAQEQPETQPENEPAMKTEIEPVQDEDPAEIPTKEPMAEPTPAVELTNLGPAPELTNEVWLNTDRPLRLADLRGTVVLLEMWTFG